MRHRLIFFTIIMISLLSTGLFQIKYRVKDLEKDLKGVNREIFEAENSIHLLEAELNYLESPRRIQHLVEQHLKLTPLKVKQIIYREQVPLILVKKLVHGQRRGKK